MLDNKGQVSLEYLMIFTISLIIIIVFTLPLANEGLKNVFDVSESISLKADLSKVTSCIKQVYSEGQGSKHGVNLKLNRAIDINAYSNHISSNLILNDNSNKEIAINYKSNLKSTHLSLSKGVNNVVVEWPVGSGNMIIYKK